MCSILVAHGFQGHLSVWRQSICWCDLVKSLIEKWRCNFEHMSDGLIIMMTKMVLENDHFFYLAEPLN